MPELPEVQTIVNQLREKIVGKTIGDIEIRMPKIFIGDRHKALGTRIIGIERRAKIILIHLDNDYTIAVHLKMTGQLVFGEEDKGSGEGRGFKAETVSFHQGIAYAGFELPAKTTHVIFSLSGGAKLSPTGKAEEGKGPERSKGFLFFNDNRQFGWVKVITKEDLNKIDEKHGPEPFSREFTVEYLQKIISGWGRSIKLLLMDQEKIAGIGNIYANEALWYSSINPEIKGKELAKAPEKVAELYKNIKKVLEMGIKYQGASDESYVNALGLKGGMQEHFMVYRQQGKPCQRCGTKIVMSRIGGRGTFFCPKCQKD